MQPYCHDIYIYWVHWVVSVYVVPSIKLYSDLHVLVPFPVWMLFYGAVSTFDILDGCFPISTTYFPIWHSLRHFCGPMLVGVHSALAMSSWHDIWALQPNTGHSVDLSDGDMSLLQPTVKSDQWGTREESVQVQPWTGKVTITPFVIFITL